MTKPTTSRRRIPIPIIVAIIPVIGAIIVAVINLLFPKLLNPTPSEITVTARIADKETGASIQGAKALLFYDAGAFVKHSDGNGIATYTVNISGRGGARLFVETDKYEIYDETIQLSGDQSVDIRLTPK